MRTSHRLLLRLYHDPACDFDRVAVTYVDRGAPGDVSTVAGPAIGALDAYYLEVTEGDRTACIPYHRIREIRYGDRVLWSREGLAARTGEG